MRSLSPLALYGTLATFGAFALMGVLFVQTGPESLQRLGLLFGVIGTAVASLVAMVRSDQSASQTNGKLDARIHNSVLLAMEARRRGDTAVDQVALNKALDLPPSIIVDTAALPPPQEH